MSEPLAIDVRHVSKTFSLPHQRRTTLKEVFLHPLTRTSYERQQALDDVSFSVGEGEFFGIVGNNGSGKSTLLKVLAGIYRHDRGTVEVNGILSPFIELGVGFNQELSGRDNVRINATLLGLGKKEIERRFDDILEFSGLERFIDQKLKNYSSGMQVRLAYSIAIQVDFDILLLDEVLAVGDQSFQEKCFATFDRFRADGKTIVLVSHDLDAVERFCDRAVLLNQGRIQAEGAPAHVLAAYRGMPVPETVSAT
jgi:ABC-type polysaccharide/polyol phosphate transport system ATPase subunit